MLNRGSMPRKRTGQRWCKFSRPECATSLETARSLANGPSWGSGAEVEVCFLRFPWIAASPISLLSLGGVCGRSSAAGKILFTGRQKCSPYLVFVLCGLTAFWNLKKKLTYNVIFNAHAEMYFFFFETFFFLNITLQTFLFTMYLLRNSNFNFKFFLGFTCNSSIFGLYSWYQEH